MFRRNKNKSPDKENIKTTGKGSEKEYFKEATAWDLDKRAGQNRSERRAWMVAGVASAIAILEAIGIAGMLPLKTVEPMVIRSDSSTGIMEVVTLLKEQDFFGKEIENRYWLNQYVTHREGWQWETRDDDRRIVGLLSSNPVQLEYADQTDPKKNPYAPVLQYGRNAVVRIETKGVSLLNTETVKGEKRETALVRYIKRVKRPGEPDLISHWAATTTYTYRNTGMLVQDRFINPVGFQVLNYRIDEESAGTL